MTNTGRRGIPFQRDWWFSNKDPLDARGILERNTLIQKKFAVDDSDMARSLQSTHLVGGSNPID